MKKLMIIGALMCAPVALMAQTTTPDMPEDSTSDDAAMQTEPAMDSPMAAPDMTGWTAEQRTFYAGLTAEQKSWWGGMTAEQRMQYMAATPEQRATLDTSIRAQVSGMSSPPMAAPATGSAQRVFAPMATTAPVAAQTERPPVCTATLKDNCQNAGEGGAPGRSRALPYWPGKPRSEGK